MAQYFKNFPVYATSSGNVAATASSGGGANAIVTISATHATDKRAYLSAVVWSYNDTPSSGRMRVYNGTSSGAIMADVDITASGPGSFFPPSPIGGSFGSRVTMELTQAGSSVIGKLNGYGYTEI